MDKKESLALFAQGRDAWYAWAATMAAEREALEAVGARKVAMRAWDVAAEVDFAGHQFKVPVDFSGFVFPGVARFNEATFLSSAEFGAVTAQFDEATFSGDARFTKATFPGGVLFDNATFCGDAWFDEATFPGNAVFSNATFSGYQAVFNEATFSDEATFDEATFSGNAVFNKATFSGDARFDKAMFSGGAWYNKATFSGGAWFGESGFGGYTQFTGARFEKAADFSAIDSKSFFSLDGATFLALPDFIQAHFAEAPRLDNSRIQLRRVGRPTLAAVNNYFKGNPDLSARWRALKRLAAQGHDHMHELEFFKNERVTGRGSMYSRWYPVFWADVFYGWFSDFGQSIVRPLILWVASALVFWLLYLGAAKAPLHCLAGSGDPWQAALWISARKALLFFGLDSSDKLTLDYACLYGVITQQPAPAGQLPTGVYLDVPDSVIALGIVQHIVSAVLLFLLLLAIRNHFRIK